MVEPGLGGWDPDFVASSNLRDSLLKVLTTHSLRQETVSTPAPRAGNDRDKDSREAMLTQYVKQKLYQD